MSLHLREVWRDQAAGEFARCIQPGAGFSFKYDGKAFGPEFADEWREIVAAKRDANRVTIEHTTGLVVTREMRVWREFNAVEYQLRFKNASRKTLAPLTDVQSLHLSFAGRVLHGNCVVSAGGGLFDTTLPPKTYAIRKRCFTSILDEHSTNAYSEEHLTTAGGHSSNRDLPFFFVQNDECQAGMFVAIGWSGQWWARAFLDPKTETLGLSGKIPGLEVALEPDEEIVGPTVLIGLYRGTLRDGSNQLRRLIRDHYTPLLAGKKFLPVATYDTYFGGIGVNFDEELLRKLVDASAALGQEYFLLDLGWFGNVNPADSQLGHNWGRGSWYEVNRSKLPNGLRPIVDHARSKGLGFGLWFEPETVDPGSQIAKEHPDWVLWNYNNHCSDTRELLTKMLADRGVLDFGRPEVQKWMCDVFDHYISEYGIRYIRYDFNMQPLPYWDANDRPNRRGVTQLRHVQGLYAVLDWLRERHPQVVLEGCAGGGRRIDLEMARRFHTFWISDYSTDPAILRFHLAGIHHFLPGNYHYVAHALPTIHQQGVEPDDLSFQSLFAAAFGTTGRVDRWPGSVQERAQRHIAVYKQLRRYLVEDYYPLSPQPGDRKSWSGWQFNDPKDRSGFVQTFRMDTPEATHRFFVKGLDEQARYRFTDVYGRDVFEMTGAEAMVDGIHITQRPQSSRVFTYKVVEGAQRSHAGRK